MPEALAVLFVFAVCAFLFISARLNSRRPPGATPPDELQRLRLQEAWLRERLDRAEREQWGREMTESLAQELRATAHRLEGGRVSSGPR